MILQHLVTQTLYRNSQLLLIQDRLQKNIFIKVKLGVIPEIKKRRLPGARETRKYQNIHAYALKDTLIRQNNTPVKCAPRNLQFPILFSKIVPDPNPMNRPIALSFRLLILSALFIQSAFTEAIASEKPDDSTTNIYRARAAAEFDKLEKSNHYTGSLSPGDLNELPVGLKKTINNTTVKIAVSNAIFYPTYAELTVYAKVEIPQSPGQIFFGVQGIRLSYTGGIVGDAKLVLLGNLSIPINGGSGALVLKGGFDMHTGQAADLTYVQIDCNGFKQLALSADLVFPKTMLVPLDPAGNRDTTKNVQASFQTVVSDWNDILVDINLPSFEITALPGIGFNIQQAVFDFSDTRNSPDISYPSDYQSKYMVPGNPNLWRGVYVKSLQVLLPKAFAKSQDSTSRIGFTAKNLLIDNNGLTGAFTATNILSFDEGSASGWQFSVNQFQLALEANHLTGAGFAGWVGLPIAGKEDTLAYTASIDANNQYLLQVSPLKTLHFHVWSAQATLLPSSYVQFKLINDRFRPEACLTGSLGITASNSTSGDTSHSIAKFTGVQFKNLRLKTEAPYLTVDYFGYNGTISLAGFPVSVDSIGLIAGANEASLGFGLNVDLMEGKFSGGTYIKVVGTFAQDGGLQRWKYQKLQLGAVKVKADFGSAFKLNGEVDILEDDPVYGNAIGGSIDATFMSKVNVKAAAIFGAKSYRYWFVDAQAGFPPIAVAGAFALTGLGGGASYSMAKNGSYTGTGVNSFRSYTPDSTLGLGLKAAVLFATTDGHVLNGEASFEVAFNKSGGMNNIGFYGYAKFIADIPGLGDAAGYLGKLNDQMHDAEQSFTGGNPDLVGKLTALKQYDPTSASQIELPDKSPGDEMGISAYMGIQYDFTTSTLHATFDLYVNAADGMLVGAASKNRAGWAVFHISPQEWYLNMGTPTDRLGVKFSIGSFSLSTGTYLMVGDNIPGSPPPPQEVADILGVDLQSLDYMRDLNALGSGQGFAFGTNITVQTGDISFLILYANFKAGLGFDVMLKNYGDAHCVGKSGPIGMNGWYANGQAYAYLQGELGIKVNLLFIHTKIPIIKGAAAALLQAKLPNPSWFTGYLGVQFDVLGGLVKGSMRLKLTVGDQCEIAGAAGSPVGVTVISDLTPKDQSAQVDVFAAPQAAFNMRVNQPFDVEDDQGTKTYRIRLEQFTVTNNGQSIPGRLEWNSNNDAVTFYSTEVLPPNQPLKASVSVLFEQQAGSGWQTLYQDGKQVEEEKDISFTTGTAPDNIPLTNIGYSYPVIGQRNMYKDESTHGYVKLKRGQSYLFSTTWKQELHITPGGGNPSVLAFTYDQSNQQLNYTIPSLTTQSGYTLDLVSIPPAANTSTEATASYQQTQAGDSSAYSVKSAQAANVSQTAVTKSLLSYTFNTSRYGTLAAKVNAWQLNQPNIGKVASDVITLQPLIQPYEAFDLPEIAGCDYTAGQPLVSAAAILDDDYFKADIDPRNYQNYPLAGSIVLTNRDTSLAGFLPVRALTLSGTYLTELQNGISNGTAGTSLPFIYNLPMVYKLDFLDLQNQVVNRFLGTSMQGKYEYLINGYYPFIRQGNYKVQYQYVLPDGTKGSNAIFNYPNPI